MMQIGWNDLESALVARSKIRTRFPRQVRTFQNIPLIRSHDTTKRITSSPSGERKKKVAFEQLQADN